MADRMAEDFHCVALGEFSETQSALTAVGANSGASYPLDPCDRRISVNVNADDWTRLDRANARRSSLFLEAFSRTADRRTCSKKFQSLKSERRRTACLVVYWS